MNTYQISRDSLLAEIVTALSNDERFVAAWLTGSLGRDDADALSDLDLNVVAATRHAETLCDRPQQVSAGTTAQRLALISRFGQPAVIHENHHNAPMGGTFTFVLYRDSALMVDWILIPESPRSPGCCSTKLGSRFLRRPHQNRINSETPRSQSEWLFSG